MIDYNDYLLQSEDYKYIDRYIDREMNIIYYNLFNHRLEDQNDRKNKVVNHILRHTVLSHFDECGVCIYLKFISNHKSINMLDRYVKIDPNTIKKPIQKLWSKKSVKNWFSLYSQPKIIIFVTLVTILIAKLKLP